MGKNSAIGWTDHTFNPWWGCAKVSPGCKNCYAETLSLRWGHDAWGAGSRRLFGPKHWNEPLAWDRNAGRAGKRARVFCASMADVFEDRDDVALARVHLWDLIERTPNLDWLILTKRPENFARLLPSWGVSRNVWLGVSAEDQEAADKRVPLLLECPAPIRFVSAEPLLGPIDFGNIRHKIAPSSFVTFPALEPGGFQQHEPEKRLDWIIIGGESGPGARPFRIDWARSILGDCRAAGVACFVKQMGANSDAFDDLPFGQNVPDRKGANPYDWPDDLRVQQFPSATGAK
jgi:protein gp37